MNSRIYLQPDAIPTQDMIRTANRLFRHFGKEVTFLQQTDKCTADLTMNRLRWALVLSDNYDEALLKSGNLIVDLSYNEDANFQEIFNQPEIANLVLIQKSGEISEFAKEDQTVAKR